MCACFWLVFYSSFVPIKDFTLSKLRYLIFTDLKFLTLSSHSSGQGYSSCWTSCTDLPLFSTLWPCCYSCTNLHTALKWLALPKPLCLAICWALSLGMHYTTIFTVLNHCIPILPSNVMFVLVHLIVKLTGGPIYIFEHWKFPQYLTYLTLPSNP